MILFSFVASKGFNVVSQHHIVDDVVKALLRLHGLSECFDVGLVTLHIVPLKVKTDIHNCVPLLNVQD